MQYVLVPTNMAKEYVLSFLSDGSTKDIEVLVTTDSTTMITVNLNTPVGINPQVNKQVNHFFLNFHERIFKDGIHG